MALAHSKAEVHVLACRFAEFIAESGELEEEVSPDCHVAGTSPWKHVHVPWHVETFHEWGGFDNLPVPAFFTIELQKSYRHVDVLGGENYFISAEEVFRHTNV